MALTDEERLEHYRKRAAATAAKTSQNGGGDFEKVKRFKFKEGMNIIRIIPPFGDRLDFYIDIEKSWLVGPTWKGPVIRPRQFGKPDPVSDLIERLKASEDESQMKRANFLERQTSKNIECFIIDRNNPQEGPQLASLNWTIFNEIMALFSDSEYADITHAETGTDLKISWTPGVRKGEKWTVKPKWQLTPARSSSPLDFPEALECDLFLKYRLEDPMGADFIEAILEGREEQFLADAKAAREAADEGGESEEGPSPPQIPSTSATDEAVRKELARIKGTKAPPPPKPKGTPPEILAASFYVVEEGNPVLYPDGKKVQELMDQGQTNVDVIKVGDDEWGTPKSYGFISTKSKVHADISAAMGIDDEDLPF